MTTLELFEEYFPGRSDVHRLLMEPITYANGSTLADPAITYGIVFSNFMNKGVFTFEGGTDKLIGLMEEELEKNGLPSAPGRKQTGLWWKKEQYGELKSMELLSLQVLLFPTAALPTLSTISPVGRHFRNHSLKRLTGFESTPPVHRYISALKKHPQSRKSGSDFLPRNPRNLIPPNFLM